MHNFKLRILLKILNFLRITAIGSLCILFKNLLGMFNPEKVCLEMKNVEVMCDGYIWIFAEDICSMYKGFRSECDPQSEKNSLKCKKI